MQPPAFLSTLTSLAAPLGYSYAALMCLRSTAYEHGMLPSWRASVPCISVGNISWGGTGKTPLVSWLLDWAIQQGMRPAVLTRGYGSKPPHLPFRVQPESSPSQCGDEPLMLARTHEQALVVVDPKRRRSGPWTETTCSPDLFVLDDGLQHLAVKRDMNLVLLAENDLLGGWNKVIPTGTWREGASALNRAHAFIINTTGSSSLGSFSIDELFPAAMKRLQPFGVPIFFVRLVPTGLAHILTKETVRHLENAPYVLFTGIARPQRIRSTITSLLGYPPVEECFFPDHHAYSDKDKQQILEQAAARGARHLVCSSKDAVKLGGWNHPLVFELRTELSFIAKANTDLWFPQWLAQTLKRSQ